MKAVLIGKAVGHRIVLLGMFLIVSLIETSVLVEGALYPPENKPRYQPELDQLSLEKYVRDESLFDLHINCLLFDGPCDPVGRWMKPRMASYFLESCILCTPNQEKEADKFMTWLFEHQPQLFRTGIAKYLDANGITLPENSKFRQQVQKMNIPKVAPVASSLSRENSDSDDDSHEQEKESPLSPPSSSLTSQQPSKASRLADYETLNNDEEQETSKLSPQYHHQQQQQQLQILTSPNQRILQTNSRRHKFSQDSNSLRRKSATASSPTSLFGHINSNQKLVISPVDQEDDEAENDFEITTQP